MKKTVKKKNKALLNSKEINLKASSTHKKITNLNKKLNNYQDIKLLMNYYTYDNVFGA